MFCNSCGSPVYAEQAVCGKCGSPVLGRPPLTRVEQHAKLLGILWIVYAIFHAIGGAVLLIVANTISGRFASGDNAAFLHPLLTGIAIFLLVKAAVCVIAGFGLIEKQTWGRPLTLLMGFISLINIPIGTALGIYTLWVLLSPHAESDYHRLAASAR